MYTIGSLIKPTHKHSLPFGNLQKPQDKMMQPEILQDSWSIYELSSFFDQVESFSFNVDTQMSDCDLNSLYSTPEENFEVFTIPCSSIMFSNDFVEYPLDNFSQQLPSLMEDISMDLGDAFDSILSSQIVGIHGYPEENEGSFDNSQHFSSEVQDSCSPTPSMMSDSSAAHRPLTLPHEDMEIDNQLAIPVLLEALAEAIEEEQNTLAEEILRRVGQKASPLGNTLERVAFYLSQDITFNSQEDYLRKEACKNLELAFQVFYQLFPHGKVAHFAANSRILESIPEDSDEIHIVDFDMGEGTQWAPLMEATAQHQHRTLKLTSIKREDESPESVFTPWNFEDTKRKLSAHAKSCGLKLRVEEKGIEDLVMELKRMNKRGGSGKREWLAFNCMVGLPHMGRPRSRRHAMEFLRVAKDLICRYGNEGIITFGDGDVCEKLKNCMNFRSFFEGNLVHYQDLLESIEANFPNKHSEARIAVESLFVAPNMSSPSWLQKWKEVRENCYLQGGLGLEGSRFSKEIVMEIGEMLNGSERSYQGRLDGDNGNELVLEWKGTQLLRISTWGI